jgi:hypothetical protein
MRDGRLRRVERSGQARPVTAEAAAIYAALFDDPVPEHLADSYAAAVSTLPLEPCPVQDDAVWASPGRLSAVEYLLRVTRGKNGLSQRFQVIFYLAELEQSLFSRFARARPSWLGGMLDLGGAGVSVPFAFARGLWWWRRVRRV